jgi:hypothetical protein
VSPFTLKGHAQMLYDEILTALHQLLDYEEDFEQAGRLQAVMVEMAVLKYRRRRPMDPEIDPVAHRREWMLSLEYPDKMCR